MITFAHLMKGILHITLISITLASALGSEPKVGNALPDLASLLPGQSLPTYRGKVVLVDFWASWCAPCKASFPALSKLHQTYAKQGLVIIGIGVDDEASAYRTFTARNKVSFSLVHDAQHRAAEYFNPPTMPTSYLIDRNGVIRYLHQGFKLGKTDDEYAGEIAKLLAE